MTILRLGDLAVMISLGERVEAETAARVRAIAAEIARNPPGDVVDSVTAFSSIAVFFGRPAVDLAALEECVRRVEQGSMATDARRVEIPVCYGGEYGPDLPLVAQHTGLSADAVIEDHAGADYLVHAIGFAPGFPYLGGMPAQLATPRRVTPRATVPAGSVGIGGVQTGVYPLATPGGWNLIGRTPFVLFDAHRPAPALLRAGDRVTFRPITPEEFAVLAAHTSEERDRMRDAAPLIETAAGVEVLKAGMQTTVQDLGRPRHRGQGVPLGGAVDPLALRVANMLVGNPEDAAALEFTLVGPDLRFHRETMIALGGADFGVPRWQPLLLRAGDILHLGPARSGCRGYIAFAGGIEVPEVLGSRSTYLRAQFGGFHGRSLRDGDVLPVPAVTRRTRDHWHIDERILPPYAAEPTLRVIDGPHVAQFRDGWTEREFKVSPQSDRMGVRLLGQRIERLVTGDLVSLPIAPGAVQVPPDGQPIVLLGDAQTIGGYPQIAHVASVDLPLAAQLRPGDAVRFRRVTFEHAQELLNARERALGMLREGITQKLA